MIDYTVPYSVAGHSTGARVALMLAAIRDDPTYMDNTKYAALLTPHLRETVSKIGVAIGDHPDPMMRNADKGGPPHWGRSVSHMPVMIVTGSRDYIEPSGSGWRDFSLMTTRDKLFLNIINGTHMFDRSPLEGHPEGPWMARYLRYYLLQDQRSAQYLFGDGTDSLVHASGLIDTTDRDRNQGQSFVGFLACRSGEVGVPAAAARYCNASAAAGSNGTARRG